MVIEDSESNLRHPLAAAADGAEEPFEWTEVSTRKTRCTEKRDAMKSKKKAFNRMRKLEGQKEGSWESKGTDRVTEVERRME